MSLSLAELNLLDWMAENLRTPFLDEVIPLLTRLGDCGILWIIMGFAFLLLCPKDRARGAKILIALILHLLLCNLLLKNLVDRIRPFELKGLTDLLISPPQDPSFPSGHTAASFATATVLFLDRWKWWWVVLVLGVVIGFTRLYLYVHYPTDVLGGVLLGILCGFLATKLWLCVSDRITRKRNGNTDG